MGQKRAIPRIKSMSIRIGVFERAYGDVGLFEYDTYRNAGLCIPKRQKGWFAYFFDLDYPLNGPVASASTLNLAEFNPVSIEIEFEQATVEYCEVETHIDTVNVLLIQGGYAELIYRP